MMIKAILFTLLFTGPVAFAQSQAVKDASVTADRCDAAFSHWRDARDAAAFKASIAQAPAAHAREDVSISERDRERIVAARNRDYQQRFKQIDSDQVKGLPSDLDSQLRSAYTSLAISNPKAGKEYPYSGTGTLDTLGHSCRDLRMLINVQTMHDQSGSEPVLPVYPH